MARITLGEQREIGRHFTLKCHGLTRQEFFSLYRSVLEEFGEPGSIPTVRNPATPFDAKSIHEIFVRIAQNGLSAASKKAIEKTGEALATFIGRQLDGFTTKEKKRIMLYGPNDKALYEIEFNVEKKKPKKVK